MVPKECGFKQSETACGLCASIARRFPCSPATARDGEMQHSCHHIDIIHHPNSSYVTTKPSPACWPGDSPAGSSEALMIDAKCEDGSTVDFIIFRVKDFVSA